MSVMPMKFWGSWPILGGDRLPYFRGFYSLLSQEDESNDLSTFDLCRGPHFTLILVASDYDQAPAFTEAIKVTQLSLSEVGLVVVLVVLTEQDREKWKDFGALHSVGIHSIRDRETFCATFGSISLVLVRPDMHIGYIEGLGQKSKLNTYLKRLVR